MVKAQIYATISDLNFDKYTDQILVAGQILENTFIHQWVYF